MYSSFAGWAACDSRFARWAEQAGYRIDYASAHDFLDTPDLLDSYNVVFQVGHGDHHTRACRDTLERHLARGGRIVRMGERL